MSLLRNEIPDEERLLILARAAYQLLKKQNESSYVLNLIEETTVWDGTECDGYCLMSELQDLLITEYAVNPCFHEQLK